MNTFAAVIPVAGLSSRMGSFKPLIMLNGFPLIELAVQSALDGGVSTVSVVTGYKAEEVMAALSSQSSTSVVNGLDALDLSLEDTLLFTCNVEYDKSDMFSSIQLGLQALLTHETLQALEAIYILPGDIPGVSPKTFVALQEKWLEAKPAVLVPSYRGKRGHPLLVSHECFAAVLARSHAQNGGLRKALTDFEWHELEVDDPGILLDADTPQALVELDAHMRKTRGVSEAVVKELFSLHRTPVNVQDHGSAVAQVALRMARLLNPLGFGLDSELCHSGGLLHDLNRVEPNHSHVASTCLRELGYEALSQVIGAHDRELSLHPTPFTEANIVFIADKLVKDTTLISTEERYLGALKKFPPDTKVGMVIQKDSRNALALLERYVKLTGDSALLQGARRT